MKDRKSSTRRRAIVVLFQSGKFQPAEIARLLKVKTRDVWLVIRQALA